MVGKVLTTCNVRLVALNVMSRGRFAHAGCCTVSENEYIPNWAALWLVFVMQSWRLMMLAHMDIVGSFPWGTICA